MKKIVLSLFAAALFGICSGQQPDPNLEYEAFKRRALREYADFRAKANADYAEFVRRAWKWVESEPVDSIPSPDPPTPPVFDPDNHPETPRPLPFDNVTPRRTPVVRPVPVDPIPDPVDPVAERVTFDFFGASCSVRVDRNSVVRLNDNSGNGISSAWKALSDDRFNAMLQDCLHLRDELHLCDWGYFQLCKRLAAALYGVDDTDDNVLLQAYLLAQSGYKMRLARADGKLYLLLSSDVLVYGRMYTELDGTRYYFFDSSYPGGHFHVCDFPFPGEQMFSLYLQEFPALPDSEVFCRELTATGYPDIRIPFCPNQNLMEFFNTYPYCRWDVHALASLSDKAKQALYPVLQRHIAGKSVPDAANLLINFVQTAFRYQTDQEQFGYERPLFGDETLNYPYSDCEDRAILYSVLVRDLLGLDVILLCYPKHLATAVCFPEPVEGDYVQFEGRRYIVCDPTYVGADIGRTMPDMDNQKAEIIVL